MKERPKKQPVKKYQVNTGSDTVAEDEMDELAAKDVSDDREQRVEEGPSVYLRVRAAQVGAANSPRKSRLSES